MGKLIKCYECQKEISSSAKACPGCGAKKKKSWWFKISATFLIAVISISWLLSGGEGSKSAHGQKPSMETYNQIALPLDYREGSLGEVIKQGLVVTTGQVIQVIGQRSLLIATGGNVFGTYTDNFVYLSLDDNPRVLDGDLIKVFGRYNGVQQYTTVLGDDRSVPSLLADYIEMIRKAE